MGSKTRSVYRCTECGAERLKWTGRCDGCDAWNSFVEEAVARTSRRGDAAPPGESSEPVRLGEVPATRMPRTATGVDEFDFVLGGGVVPGSMVLVGGEPGIGKSTLLLQAAGRLGASGMTVLYVSGEESADQVRLRAERMGDIDDSLLLLPEVRLETILERAREVTAQAIVVDSIQTVYSDELEGAPGNVGQVRECASRLMRYAKEHTVTVFLVGHVTRGGGIAGPKTLEHIVDTVLYFEGEAESGFRVLRAVKNRFGSVDEVGIFEMTGTGLRPVGNPSAAFLVGRADQTAGSAVTALIEGSRPVLVEVQALAAKSGFSTAQRVTTGFDARRLAVLLAVLERRAGIPFHGLDVFVNVTGGLRVAETGSDLAVVASLISSVHDIPLPSDTLFLGEVGLGGEIRAVPALDRRIGEAARLGFARAYVPERARIDASMALRRVGHVSGLVQALRDG